MFHVPSICNNPLCKLMFPSGIVVGGNSNVSFENCAAGPCPRCGSIGNIPNGEYRSFQIDIFKILYDIGDIKKLKEIKATIEKALTEKTKRANINSKLKSIAPEIGSEISVIDWAKEHEVVIRLIFEFLFLLISALTLATSCAPMNVTYNTVIKNTFNQFYGFPVNEPHDENQIENKSDQTKSLQI